MPPFNASSFNMSDIASMNITDFLNVTEADIQYTQSVETAPVYLLCCTLSLAAISAFLRAGFVLKFIAMMCCIGVQGFVLRLSKLYAFYDHERERFDSFVKLHSNDDNVSFVLQQQQQQNSHFFSLSSSNFGLATTGVFFLMLIAIVLHILDRQGDFVARTDFLWKAKLKTEQEEVETMRGINKVTFYIF